MLVLHAYSDTAMRLSDHVCICSAGDAVQYVIPREWHHHTHVTRFLTCAT